MLFSWFRCGLTPLFSKKTSGTSTDRAARPVGHILPEGMRTGGQTWIVLCSQDSSWEETRKTGSARTLPTGPTETLKKVFQFQNNTREHSNHHGFQNSLQTTKNTPFESRAEQCSPSSTKENMRCIRARSWNSMVDQWTGFLNPTWYLYCESNWFWEYHGSWNSIFWSQLLDFWCEYLNFIQKHYSRGVWTPKIRYTYVTAFNLAYSDAFSYAKLCVVTHFL